MTADEILEQVKALSTAELEPIVRLATGDSSAVVGREFQSNHITAPSRRTGTFALMRITGTATSGSGSRPWSVVLKVVEERGGPSDDLVFNSGTEVTAYDSGILSGPLEGIRPATLFETFHRDGLVWLWMEDLKDLIGPPWELEHYVSAARGIGRFGGSFAADLPENEAWMTDDLILTRWSDAAMTSMPGTNDHIGATPPLTDYLSGDLARLYPRLIDAMDRLRPALSAGWQTLCHGDCHARNLFIDQQASASPEVVGIDWGGLGIGPLGSDIGTMVGSSLTWASDEADIIIRGDLDIFGAYLDGLRSVGWTGADEEARIGYAFSAGGYGRYLATFPIIVESRFPGWEFFRTRLGADSDDLENRCLERLGFAVELVEEAVNLIP